MTRIKNINTRIQLKNDTETNWNKAKAEEGKDGFIPLLGEAIVYMGDNNHGPRLKIGDGITNVTDLPFLEDKDTVYTASNGIKITAENIIQHINYLDAFPSEIGFYKIKYDQNGHINGATAVSKQDIINLLEITPGRIDSVQITAEAPLVSSNSTENTTSLITNISFNTQEKNTVLAGPSNAASGSPSFRLLIEDDIPNLSASKITGTFSANQIGNLPASKIDSGTFHEDRIPNLGPSKISGVIPVSKGGTGVDGINGDPEHNINSFINNGVFAYDSGNACFKQFRITALGSTDTFTSYVNSLEGATTNLLVDLSTLIKAIPPMNLNNPRDITGNYIDSYYAPKTKGWKNSVLISQGGENLNDGVEPIWLNPNSLSAEGSHGGALFYGRDNTSENTVKPFKTQWGTLPVEQGGTGITNFNNNYVLIGSGENPIRTIQKTSSLISNTIVERDTNGDFATRSITLSQNLLCNNINENFKDNKIISINSSNKLATFFGNVNANNLTAFIGELKMSKTNSETIDQPSIKWYKGNSIKTESAITSQTNTLIGELYWDHNNSNRGMLRNYYLANNAETYSDSYYLPETDTSSANNHIFTLLATEDSISNMFPSNSILYSNGKVNKITYKNSADGALYSTSTNGNLEWGTLPVAQGGTGLTTSGTVNAVIIGNSVESYKTRAFQTVSTNNGAFYATGVNSKPEFGTLPIGQGGTGVTSIADIQAGKDGDGNTISSTYLKLSGGTLTGNTYFNSNSGERFFYITKQGDATESAKMWIDDSYFHIDVINDETTANISFKLQATDTESGEGAGAQTSYVSFLGENNKSKIIADYFQGDLIGNAETATKFASSQSITLTGDTTGTVSSQAGWSITTKTDRLSTVDDNRTVATIPNDYANKIIFQGLKTNSSFNSPSTNTYSYVIGLRGWSDSTGGKAHEFAFNDSGINHRIGQSTSWENWEKIITSGNYTDYTVTKTGSGASGTWGINITGNAATATKATQDGNGNTISSTYLKVSGGTLTGNLIFKASSTNAPYIVWYYGGDSGTELARLWIPIDGLTSKTAPYFREFSSDGTKLYSGWLTLGDGTGASGTWGINVTGSAGSVAGENISGKVAVNHGGTGANTAAGARTNLDVPSTTGSGASGTWGINISGNAATATTASSCSSANLTDIALTWASSYTTGTYLFIYNGETGSNGGRLLRAINQTNSAKWIQGGANGTWNINVTGNAANVTGTVAVDHGGTGATSKSGARTNLGIHYKDVSIQVNHNYVDTNLSVSNYEIISLLVTNIYSSVCDIGGVHPMNGNWRICLNNNVQVGTASVRILYIDK